MHTAFKFFAATALMLTLAAVTCAQDSKEPLKVGDKITPFKLESMGEKWIDSSEQFGSEGSPAVLLFSRANW